MEKDRYRILNRLLEKGLKGVDKYTHNDSTWLIFTDEKKWVIELTKDKVLWYNHIFFSRLFCIVTNDMTIYQKYITKWVEDNVINKTKYPPKTYFKYTPQRMCENVIENGIKETKIDEFNVSQFLCEYVIDNGVKETEDGECVSVIYAGGSLQKENVDSIINYGVKEIKYANRYDTIGPVIKESKVIKVIEEGIKNPTD